MTIDAGPDELYTTLAREADVEALAALALELVRGKDGMLREIGYKLKHAR